MCDSTDSDISSQEDRSTFDKNYEPSSQSLMSGEMTESEASWRESTMADNEDGVLEDGEVKSHRHSIQDTDLLSPGEFLAMKENANSRKNMQVVGDMYARVMRALAEKEGKGESYPSLKEAPVERLPYLVEKFIQAARKSNMEVYASGTFHFIWNRVANILSSRETDPVNVKTDVNFRRAREILARSFLLLEY